MPSAFGHCKQFPRGHRACSRDTIRPRMPISFVSLLTDLADIIGPEDRRLGEQLFDQGAVDSPGSSDATSAGANAERSASAEPNVIQERDVVRCTVAGSRDEGIEVAEAASTRISWSDAPAGVEVEIQCSCTRYGEGFLCAHLWASFLASEANGALREISNRRLAALIRATPAPRPTRSPSPPPALRTPSPSLSGRDSSRGSETAEARRRRAAGGQNPESDVRP